MRSQLYLPNNPIYQGAINALRSGFVALWNETDELQLVLTEHELRWYGVAVSDHAQSGSKSSDNLAWLFYKDGVRELTLTKGFEEEESIKFLAIIQRARKANADDDDLVAMLWEADFTFLQYKYVDLLAEGGEGGDLADGGAAGPPPDPGAVRESTQAAVEESRAQGIVTVSDFDSTLYFLDDREIEYLHEEIRREYAIDLRVNIVVDAARHLRDAAGSGDPRRGDRGSPQADGVSADRRPVPRRRVSAARGARGDRSAMPD